jgi:predicted permease
MSEIVTVALPFFGLLFLGYGTGRLKVIPGEGLAGLDFFVFYMALPALLFQVTATTPWSEMPDWSFLLTTTFSTYCAFAIAFSFGALVSRGNIPEATVQGLVGSYSNVAYLAPGLTLAAFGAGAGAPTALVFTFDTAMFFCLVPLLMALGGTERIDLRAAATSIGRDIFLHPMILATIAGVLAALLGLKVPGPIDALLSFLRSAAAPAALFACGLGLSRRPVEKPASDLPFLVGVKLVAHPLIVYLLLSWIGGFEPAWTGAAILMAALPPAARVLVLARKYSTYRDGASTAIILGTIASIVTLTVVLTLVVLDLLPVDPFH